MNVMSMQSEHMLVMTIQQLQFSLDDHKFNEIQDEHIMQDRV